jgi:hypothetical protein
MVELELSGQAQDYLKVSGWEEKDIRSLYMAYLDKYVVFGF